MTRCLLLMCVLCHFNSWSQEIDTSRFWNSIDFMVIPYTAEGQSIQEVLAKEPDYRSIIGTLQDQLLERDFKVKDFLSKYEKYSGQSQRMKKGIALTKQYFLDVASPDIFIEVEIIKQTCHSNQHRVAINLKSFLTASHTLLSRKVFSSNCFERSTKTIDLFYSAVKMHQIFPEFSQQLRRRITKQISFGQTLEVHVNIDNDFYHLNAMVTHLEDSMTLHEVIRQWLYEHPLFEYDDGGGVDSDRSWVMGEVSIPVVDPKTSKPYPLYKFTSEFRNFLHTLSFVETFRPEKMHLKNRQVQNTLYLILE